MNKLFFLILIAIISFNCQKGPNSPNTTATLPTITTSTVTSITATTAASGGNISSDGGATVTARGVCWSTTPNPVATGNHSTDGNGIGTFTSAITGLTASTIYYVRAYATNSAGTAYGNEISFTTTAITPTIPTLTTTAISSITTTTALSGGNIANDGGATITVRGVCWSTIPNPTIALSTKTSDGIGTGTFSSSIIGLTPNTTYYERAYATNSVGTAYGSQQTFTTLPTSNTFTDIDGNIYPIITICNQVWVQKNLNVSRYSNGDLIPKVTDNLQWATLATGAWCWYNNDSATYASVYGKLYNWYAVNDARGLVPPGWHIPSESDWKKLEKCVDPSADTTCPVFTCVPSLTGGGSLKESGISHWQNPNTGATNSTGFTGLPGGYRYQSGIFDFVGQTGYWWSSGAYTTGNAYDRYLGFGDTYIYRSAPEKIEGLSVRIIKD